MIWWDYKKKEKDPDKKEAQRDKKKKINFFLIFIILVMFSAGFYQNSFDYLYSSIDIVALDKIHFFGFGDRRLNLKYTNEQLLKIEELKKSQYVKEYISCRAGSKGRSSRKECIEKESGIDQEYVECKKKYFSKKGCKLGGGYYYFRLNQIDLSNEQVKILKNFSAKIYKILFFYLILALIINYLFFRYCFKRRILDHIMVLIYNLALYIFIRTLV